MENDLAEFRTRETSTGALRFNDSANSMYFHPDNLQNKVKLDSNWPSG